MVMFFTGRHSISVEENGRISLPSALRAPLREGREGDGGVDTLYVFPSLDRACLEAAGAAYLEGRRRILMRMKPFDPRREALERLYFGEARALSMDAKGRITLPQDLRECAALVQDALLVGMGDRFQIWSPGREAGRRSAALEAAANLKDIEAPWEQEA
jgi:MraZ protein